VSFRFSVVFFYFARNRLHFAKEWALKDFTGQPNIIDAASFSLMERLGSLLDQY